ncbi:MAG: hypothetical protein LBU32_19850 [Clostridiales bacterium]|jgi:hypothetical protein|nr:hypothetical protein [Clostridiales bacterium]
MIFKARGVFDIGVSSSAKEGGYMGISERVEDLRRFQSVMSIKAGSPDKANAKASYLLQREVKEYLGIGRVAVVRDLARSGINYIQLGVMHKYSVVSLAKMLTGTRLPYVRMQRREMIKMTGFNVGRTELEDDIEIVFGSGELSIFQGAEYLNVSGQFLAKLLARARVPLRPSGTCTKVSAGDFARWIKACERTTVFGGELDTEYLYS